MDLYFFYLSFFFFLTKQFHRVEPTRKFTVHPSHGTGLLCSATLRQGQKMGGLEGCGRSKMEDWGRKRRTHLRAKIFVETRQINNSWTRHFRGTKTHLSLVLYSLISGSLSSFLVERDPTKATFPSPVGQSHPYQPLIYISNCSCGNPAYLSHFFHFCFSLPTFDRLYLLSPLPHSTFSFLPTSLLRNTLRIVTLSRFVTLDLLSLSSHFMSSRFLIFFLIFFFNWNRNVVEMLFYI